MNTLNFNDADLKANREGRLSDAQRKRLDTEIDQVRKQARGSIRLWLGFFVFITVCMLINTTSYTILSHLTSPGFTIITAFFFVMVLLIVIQYSWDTRRLLKTQICSMEGTVKVRIAQPIHPWQSQCSYELFVYKNSYSPLIFRFKDRESLSYFKDEMCYRLYYLKITESTLLLSAEEIEPEKAKR